MNLLALIERLGLSGALLKTSEGQAVLAAGLGVYGFAQGDFEQTVKMTGMIGTALLGIAYQVGRVFLKANGHGSASAPPPSAPPGDGPGAGSGAGPAAP